VFGTRRTDQLDVNFDLNVNFDLKDLVFAETGGPEWSMQRRRVKTIGGRQP